MTLCAETFFSALVRATGLGGKQRRLVGDRAEGYVPLKVRTHNEQSHRLSLGRQISHGTFWGNQVTCHGLLW